MCLHVFILNGWATEPKLWEPFIEALCSSRTIRREAVYLLDWDKAIDQRDYKGLALSFIENKLMESGSDFMVMGWSLGAMVALDIVSELKDKPKMLFILSGSEAFCHEDASLGWPQKAVEAMKGHLVKDRSSTLKTFYQRIFTRRERDLGLDQIFLESSCQLPEGCLIGGLDYLIQTDVHQKLRAIDVPVLWLHGANDRICPIGSAKSAIVHLKKSQLVSLAEAGHGLFMTSEETCIESLWHFMNSESILS